MRELIRNAKIDGFTFRLYDTGTYDNRGCTRLDWEAVAPDGEMVKGGELCGSPGHADDSNDTLACLVGFLSATHCWDAPGEEDVREFSERHSDDLSIISSMIEEHEGELEIEEGELE